MRTFHLLRSLAALGILLALGLSSNVYGQRHEREERHDDRDLIARTQHDLERTGRMGTLRGKEKERYDNAMRHLSEFDRELSQGRFDKDKLDAAIEDVHNVADHNTLEPQDRNRLNDDLRDLRTLRATRGAAY
jgi:hypothetical protein